MARVSGQRKLYNFHITMDLRYIEFKFILNTERENKLLFACLFDLDYSLTLSHPGRHHQNSMSLLNRYSLLFTANVHSQNLNLIKCMTGG